MSNVTKSCLTQKEPDFLSAFNHRHDVAVRTVQRDKTKNGAIPSPIKALLLSAAPRFANYNSTISSESQIRDRRTKATPHKNQKAKKKKNVRSRGSKSSSISSAASPPVIRSVSSSSLSAVRKKALAKQKKATKKADAQQRKHRQKSAKKVEKRRQKKVFSESQNRGVAPMPPSSSLSHIVVESKLKQRTNGPSIGARMMTNAGAPVLIAIGAGGILKAGNKTGINLRNAPGLWDPLQFDSVRRGRSVSSDQMRIKSRDAVKVNHSLLASSSSADVSLRADRSLSSASSASLDSLVPRRPLHPYGVGASHKTKLKLKQSRRKPKFSGVDVDSHSETSNPHPRMAPVRDSQKKQRANEREARSSMSIQPSNRYTMTPRHENPYASPKFQKKALAGSIYSPAHRLPPALFSSFTTSLSSSHSGSRSRRLSQWTSTSGSSSSAALALVNASSSHDRSRVNSDDRDTPRAVPAIIRSTSRASTRSLSSSEPRLPPRGFSSMSVARLAPKKSISGLLAGPSSSSLVPVHVVPSATATPKVKAKSGSTSPVNRATTFSKAKAKSKTGIISPVGRGHTRNLVTQHTARSSSNAPAPAKTLSSVSAPKAPIMKQSSSVNEKKMSSSSSSSLPFVSPRSQDIRDRISFARRVSSSRARSGTVIGSKSYRGSDFINLLRSDKERGLDHTFGDAKTGLSFNLYFKTKEFNDDGVFYLVANLQYSRAMQEHVSHNGKDIVVFLTLDDVENRMDRFLLRHKDQKLCKTSTRIVFPKNPEAFSASRKFNFRMTVMEVDDDHYLASQE